MKKVCENMEELNQVLNSTEKIQLNTENTLEVQQFDVEIVLSGC
ncbi:hypothetical protein [Bacillus mycoides]